MQKKIPMRQCVGCREMKAKKELVRVVRSPEGEISLDFRGKAPGRGAYVCPQTECLKRAIKSKALERGLDCQIPQEIYDQLLLRMEADQQQKALRLLGLARRARLLEIGEEPVGIACRGGRAKLLLVAKDAGDHTFRRARSFVSGGKCPYICVPYTKDELGDGLGCNACALCAFTDPAFAKSFLEALGDEAHAEILVQLTVQAQRVLKRRQEAQAHRKNVKTGKK